MPGINYPINRYIATFSNIRKAAEQHSYLWNKEVIPEEGLEFLSIGIDELQRQSKSYGLAKGKDGKLHFYKRDNDEEGYSISIKELAKDFQKHNSHGTDLSLNEIGTRFVEGISEYLRQYLIASRVDNKVKRNRQALEKMLSLDSED